MCNCHSGVCVFGLTLLRVLKQVWLFAKATMGKNVLVADWESKKESWNWHDNLTGYCAKARTSPSLEGTPFEPEEFQGV